MARWRVWIGSPRVGLAEWKPYVVAATDQIQAIREAYAKITGLRRAPALSWIAWNVRQVEVLDRG